MHIEPCPFAFCNRNAMYGKQKAKRDHAGDIISQRYYVCCPNKHAYIIGESLEEAVIKWNERK